MDGKQLAINNFKQIIEVHKSYKIDLGELHVCRETGKLSKNYLGVKNMFLRKCITSLSIGLTTIFGITGAAFADTYLVSANNTSGVIHLNTSYPIQPGTARWNPLDATIDAEGVTYSIRDTHEQCDGGGWRIQTDMRQGENHLRTHDYCIQLGFAEVGCLAVRVDPGNYIAMNKVSGFHCSNQWWDDQQGLEVFQSIIEAAGNAVGAVQSN